MTTQSGKAKHNVGAFVPTEIWSVLSWASNWSMNVLQPPAVSGAQQPMRGIRNIMSFVE